MYYGKNKCSEATREEGPSEVAAALARFTRAEICLLESIIQSMLVCPEDESAIRTAGAEGIITMTANALAPGASVSITIPAIGFKHCLGLGLETGVVGLAATDSYVVVATRAGSNASATWTREELAASTANPRAAGCKCGMCVGANQAVVLTLTNNGPAAYAAVASVGWKFCRVFARPSPINVAALCSDLDCSGGGWCRT